MARPKPKMETEERTLEALEALPPLLRALAVHTYIVAAYWPWWMVLFFPSLILWRTLQHIEVFAWAAGVFAVLAIGGVLGKGAIEKWVERKQEQARGRSS